MRSTRGTIVLAVLLNLTLGIELQAGPAEMGVLRGWLADEGCARGRCDGAKPRYGPTNPECARDCVAKGAKIVLILPEEKEILNIGNQEIAKDNVGNYVEVSGSVDVTADGAHRTRIIHIGSLKMLKRGVSM